MTKRYKFIALTIVILAYALMQIATKKEVCDNDCQAMQEIYNELQKVYPAVHYVERCIYPITDSICVYVIASTGGDWNQIAEKTCSLATANGLLQQKVFILGGTSSTMDTLARLQCP
jgi:hypothetical protein